MPKPTHAKPEVKKSEKPPTINVYLTPRELADTKAAAERELLPVSRFARRAIMREVTATRGATRPT